MSNFDDGTSNENAHRERGRPTVTAARAERISREFRRLYIDCTYSGQIHFEAAKSAEFLGKALVFIPAVISAIAALLVALGYDRSLGAVSAIAAAVTATATFLGPERKAPSHRSSGKAYTKLRHQVRLEQELLDLSKDPADAEERLRILRETYSEILTNDEPTPNRFYRRVDKRISKGDLAYREVDDATKSGN